MPALLQPLHASPLLAGGYVFFLGLCVGSFLNVVVHRLPLMLERRWQAEAAALRGEPVPEWPRLNLLSPRSRCPHCGHAISALENIPVLSWLVLRGRCRACRAPIGIRYPLVELGTALLSLLVFLALGPSAKMLAALGLTWALVALALIDLDTQLLPDDITLPLLWAGLLINLRGTFAPLPAAVIGAAAGYLSLWSVYWLFRLATGREGMGYGDFKLMAALGAWLGWLALPLILLLSSVLGAVVGLGYLVVRRQSAPFAFGPYIALAGLIALLWGQPLLRWYLGI